MRQRDKGAGPQPENHENTTSDETKEVRQDAEPPPNKRKTPHEWLRDILLLVATADRARKAAEWLGDHWSDVF